MSQRRSFDRHQTPNFRNNSADSCLQSQDVSFCNCPQHSGHASATPKRASSSYVAPLWRSMQDYNDDQVHPVVLDDRPPTIGGSPDYVVVMRMQTHSADSSCSTSTTNIHKPGRKHRGSSGSNSLDSNPGGGGVQTPKRSDQQQTGNLLMASSLPPSYASAASAGSAAASCAAVGSSSQIPFAVPTFEHSTISISIDLVTAAQREANFLRMIDRKAPILYEQAYARNALRRYECFWLPMQGKFRDVNIVPPLDVHWLWHTHMLSPLNYEKDCLNLVGFVIDHKLMSPEEIQERYQQSVSAWENFCGPNEPYDFLAVSSPSNNSPNTSHQLRKLSDYQQKCSYDILGAAQRQQNFNYQISLPHYTSPKFLTRASDRYLKFLFLKAHYPNEFLTPCYDFDLVWHCHQVHPVAYASDTKRLMGKILKHDDSVSDRNTGSKLLQGEALTKRLWHHHFCMSPRDPASASDQGFWLAGAMYRGHEAPRFINFDQQDMSNVTYGQVHIPCITLKDIPARRDHLKLKLNYGSKKITTFNADLSNKDATKDGFCLLWQPVKNGPPSPSTSRRSVGGSGQQGSAVHFNFERSNPKFFTVELELYDKLFLQKKDTIKMTGRSSLDELLPPQNSKFVQTGCHLMLVQQTNFHANGNTDPSPSKTSASEAGFFTPMTRGPTAKVSLTTSLALMRDLQLTNGEFSHRDLIVDTPLFDLCKACSLNKCSFNTSTKCWIAAHSLIDPKDNTQYVAQIIHSAPALLSSVMIFGRDQRLLAMAHLIGSDTLPSKTQLDANLFLPHLSSCEERAMVVMSRDGDFAIIKAKWTGFQKRVRPSTTAPIMENGLDELGEVLAIHETHVRQHASSQFYAEHRYQTCHMKANQTWALLQYRTLPCPDAEKWQRMNEIRPLIMSGLCDAKGKPGNPGRLSIEVFNLMKNTVQKFDLPGSDGSTTFVIGDAQTRLPGKRIQCRSPYVAEHLASVFAVAVLFVLCNPDKVRSRDEAASSVGLTCHKWPLVLAAGYGKDNPSNRYLAAAAAANQQGSGSTAMYDASMVIAAAMINADFAALDVAGLGDMGAACGACGACGGCGACGACGGCGSCGGCGGCGGCG